MIDGAMQAEQGLAGADDSAASLVILQLT